MQAGKFVPASDINEKIDVELYPCYGGNGLRGYTETYTHKGQYPLIGRQGALCGNVHMVSGNFHATEHAIVVTPFSNINIDWLFYQLRELNLNQYSTGRAQPRLSVTNLKTVSIAVPSLAEQQKVISEIKEIELKIAELEKELSTIPDQKNAILKKYLE